MSSTIQSALRNFYEQVGDKYPEEELVYETLRGRLRKEYVLSVLATFRGSLLDVGCNRGMYLLHYKGGFRCGIDLSHAVLRRVPSDCGLHLVVADAENLACLRTAQFDHVLCSEVLEHCLHPQRVFEGIFDVLRPGGTALLTTPNYRGKRPQWIAPGVLTDFGVTCECNAGYYHTAYRPAELQQMAEKTGFQVLDVGTLEKEVKYAAKVPAALLIAGRLFNRLLRSERLGRANEAFFHRFTLVIYRVMRKTRLEKLVLPFIREGVRSRILLQKPQIQ